MWQKSRTTPIPHPVSNSENTRNLEAIARWTRGWRLHALVLAGFALLGAIQKSLADTLAPGAGAQAGLLSFMVTASGVNLFGISAAFWGVVAGLAAWHLGRIGQRLART